MFHQDTLEFNKIKESISKYACLKSSRDKILAIEPTNKKHRILEMLNMVDEAFILTERYEKIYFEDIEIEYPLNRLKKYASLNGNEFLEIVRFINICGYLSRYQKKVNSLNLSTENLNEYFDNIVSLNALKDEIVKVVDDFGNVVDDASIELRQIRNQIRTNESRIKEKLNQILKNEASKLTEPVLTIRNNRFVVPVKVEYKNTFKGMIHDESSSGSTVFIEPYQVLELSNQNQSLLTKEHKEIERILYDLSLKTAKYLGDLFNNLSNIISLDVIFAKAKYAQVNKCSKPNITENFVNLINARHPLIDIEKCVPNTIKFKDYKTIVVTGPNTGGKTVLLKTFGLLSLMVQSGMLIPVTEGSSTVIFDSVFADIGDEQSIEQSLSTFSSHMTKIIDIVNNYTHGSLILLDELGSGTDPKEGASLAIAIIEYFMERGAYILATTHYPELKAYAYDKMDICNASVEFDVDSLKPTYKLLLGIPGRSNAFLISSRLGLDKRIIDKAQNITLDLNTNVDDLIKKLERQSFELNEQTSKYFELIKKNKELEEFLLKEKEKMMVTYQEEIIKINKEHDEIITKAKEEALKMLDSVKELSKKQEIKAHEIALEKFKLSNTNTTNLDIPKINNQNIVVGDNVRIIKYNQIGKVVGIKNNKYEVLLGNISAKFDLSEIEFITTKDYKKDIVKSTKKKETQVKSIKIELDLRGHRYEEAEFALDSFIDSCLMNNLEYAYIIHGFGTGVIRNLVKDYIKKNKVIKSSRFGNETEGGFGVTVVYFK